MSNMTHDELITVARSHTADMPQLSGEPWATLENLADVKVVEAAVVSFESAQHPRKIVVILEKNSGKFILSGLIPRKSGGQQSR